MSLIARTLVTGTLAVSLSTLLLAQHGGGGYGGGFGGRMAGSGHGGQAFAAPSIGTRNAISQGHASYGYGSNGYGYNNGYGSTSNGWRFGFGFGYANGYNNGYGYNGYGYNGYGYNGYGYNGRWGYNRYRNYPVVYWLTPYYYPGLYDTGPGFDSYESYPYDTGPSAQAREEEMAQNQPPPYSAYPGPEAPPMNPYLPQGPPPGYSGQPYGAPPPAQPAAPSADTTPPPPPITLVLRTGEKLQVHNYAVVGQTFWDFTKTPARKIPIANIDLPASTKATEAGGAEFPPIS